MQRKTKASTLSKQVKQQKSNLQLDVNNLVGTKLFAKPIKFNFSQGDLKLPAFFARTKDNKIWGCAVDFNDNRGFVRAHLECIEKIIQNREDIIDKSGFGCAFTVKDAVEHAILELIEYDSLFNWWVNKEKVKKIKHLPHDIKNILGENSQNIKDIGFYQLPSKFDLPCIFVFVNFNSWPWIGCGIKCALDIDKALQGALFEAQQMRFNLKIINDTKNYKTLAEKRALFWSDEKNHYLIKENLSRIGNLYFNKEILSKNIIYDIIKKFSIGVKQEYFPIKGIYCVHVKSDLLKNPFLTPLNKPCPIV